MKGGVENVTIINEKRQSDFFRNPDNYKKLQDNVLSKITFKDYEDYDKKKYINATYLKKDGEPEVVNDYVTLEPITKKNLLITLEYESKYFIFLMDKERYNELYKQQEQEQYVKNPFTKRDILETIIYNDLYNNYNKFLQKLLNLLITDTGDNYIHKIKIADLPNINTDISKFIDLQYLNKYIKLIGELPTILNEIISKDDIEKHTKYYSYVTSFRDLIMFDEFNPSINKIVYKYNNLYSRSYIYGYNEVNGVVLLSQFMKNNFNSTIDTDNDYIINIRNLYYYIDSFDKLPIQFNIDEKYEEPIISRFKALYENKHFTTLTSYSGKLLLDNITIKNGLIYNKILNIPILGVTEQNIVILETQSAPYYKYISFDNSITQKRVLFLPKNIEQYINVKPRLTAFNRVLLNKEIPLYYLPTDDDKIPGYYVFELRQLKDIKNHPITGNPLNIDIIQDINNRLKKITSIQKSRSKENVYPNPIYNIQSSAQSKKSKSSASSQARLEKKNSSRRESQSYKENITTLPGQIQ